MILNTSSPVMRECPNYNKFLSEIDSKSPFISDLPIDEVFLYENNLSFEFDDLTVNWPNAITQNQY